VRRDLIGAARFLALPTLLLLGVVGFLPGRVGLALRIYVLVLCGVALVLALEALRRAYPPETVLRPHALRARRTRTEPPSLQRLEQEVALGIAGSFDFHHGLRPRLRALAAELLAGRRGISLDGERDEARAALGIGTWELVRENRPLPEDRLARGLNPAEIGHAIDSLERI
jgi:hypothetical protein